MGVRKISLAAAVLVLLAGTAPELWAGSTNDEKPAFATGDSFQTKTVAIPIQFKTADGSVHPAGSYSFKVQGTGKPGKLAVSILTAQGKPIGSLEGRYRVMRPRPADAVAPRFDKRGFSSASPVQVKLEGQQCLVFFLGGIPGGDAKNKAWAPSGADAIWIDLSAPAGAPPRR
jgi:hypothetical protein